MSIETIKALQSVCIEIQNCLPQLASVIAQDRAQRLAEATERLIHCLDHEPLDPQFKPPQEHGLPKRNF